VHAGDIEHHQRHCLRRSRKTFQNQEGRHFMQILSSSLIREQSSGVFERRFLEKGDNFPGVILQLALARGCGKLLS
jgi:hypothetical protein